MGHIFSVFARYILSDATLINSLLLLVLLGSEVIVRSITLPPSKANTLVVAGTFSAAGSLPCQGICQFDASLRQWSQLGQGIQGEVSCVVYTVSRSYNPHCPQCSLRPPLV